MDLRPQIDLAEVVMNRAINGGGCWCGNVDLEPLRPDYATCPNCGTVVYTEPYDRAVYATGEAGSFYDDSYWQHHVPEVLGLPELELRARLDLPERAVFQLEKILCHLPPGARVLELGCGAGSLTYLLQHAGFRVTGLELGPAAIALARSRFGVEVVRGPLEAWPTDERFDAIVGIDVLEHLPDPVGTLEACLERLEDDGLIFLQTPCYRGEGAEWQMLLPGEHLFLFTTQSVERLLDTVGCRFVNVEDSLFPHDMWVAASPREVLETRPDPLAEVSPIALALIDARSEAQQLVADRNEIDVDRQAKAVVVERLEGELAGVRADQQAKQELLDAQHGELADLRRDQHSKAELIDRLDGELIAVRGEHMARGELIDRLSRDLEQVRADQQAKEDAIQQLDAILRQRASELESAWRQQREVEAALQGKEATAQTAYAQLEQRTAELHNTESELGRTRHELATVRADRFFRFGTMIRSWLGKNRR